MASQPSWSGSIEFRGFPIAVQAYNQLVSRYDKGLRNLDPKYKLPLKQKMIDRDGNEVSSVKAVKGVEVGRDRYVPLTDQALELLTRATKSDLVTVERFSLLSTVPVDKAIGRFRIVPDSRSLGAVEAAQVLWNGLRSTKRAAVIPGWAPRAGSKPSVFVIFSDDEGLVGLLLPFLSEVKQDIPSFEPVVDRRASTMFKTVMETFYSTEGFDHGAYVDDHAARHQAAVEMAMSAPQSVEKEDSHAPMPNLMELMQASITEVQATNPKARKPTATRQKKVAA